MKIAVIQRNGRDWDQAPIEITSSEVLMSLIAAAVAMYPGGAFGQMESIWPKSLTWRCPGCKKENLAKNVNSRYPQTLDCDGCLRVWQQYSPKLHVRIGNGIPFYESPTPGRLELLMASSESE